MPIAPHLNHHELDHARRLLLKGEPLPGDVLPEAIARSWQRSKEAGIHPWDNHMANSAVTDCPLTEDDHILAACIEPELARLWEVFGGPEWALMGLNSGGVIVCRSHHTDFSPLSALQIGTRILESDIGTTAPGLTLAEKKPIVLTGSHHYLKEFERFFCVSIPIYQADGRLAGALDITGIGERNTRVVFEQLRQAVMAVESRLLQHYYRQHWLYSLHPNAQLLGTHFQGMAAFSASGTLLAATSNARQMLALPASGEASALPFALSDLNNPASQFKLPLKDGTSLMVRRHGQANSDVAARQPSGLALLGDDAELERQFTFANKAFEAGIAVLLCGETGTGKEVFAKALHDLWDPQAPFVAINCSALPESLIEAELFGYEEGTFTGARKGGASGRLEDANGGTLLLDEIGDMPLALQSRLLRVLQERAVTRLGSSTPRPLNIRIISATHCDLAQMMAQKAFRADLYYRLKGVQIALPALRQRSDLATLIKSILLRHGHCTLDEASLSWLKCQNWPGNIRELEQTLHLASVLAGPGNTITPDHLPQYQAPEQQRQTGPLQQAEQQTINAALQRHNGNISATAQALGISRTTLYAKLKKQG
ncbi:sigma-54-dependent Fis family transcriptional regulator [Gallaecimonas mangrovi]|uniref:sigma-54-dependent Fis family transcriptional regulator n=1 Tax=Gallaecimonas mangrovi TaxID=2291597 RepID=UPI000E1FCE76|nr:sigma-54-dependent Fis family transcriptional regulator [Gallaecimonas mangrovi]